MPELKVTFVGDATQLQRDLRNIPVMAQTFARDLRGSMEQRFRAGRTSGNIANTIFNPNQAKDAAKDYASWWSKAMTEQTATRAAAVARTRTEYFAEIAERNRLVNQTASGGGFMRGLAGARAASSMFVSAARDTMTSLASGAPITQVMAQQGPQVLQGFAMMGLSLKALGLYAAAAGLALLTLKKGADAYQAKLQEVQSQSDLWAQQGDIRGRLKGLLASNAGRMNPGEAAGLTSELNQAFAADFSNSTSQTAQQLKDVEDRVRARLKEVILTEKEKTNLKEIGQISTENLINTLSGIDKEKAMADQKYRETKARIKELAATLTSPQDLNNVAWAYTNARLAHDKEIADIELKGNKEKAVRTQSSSAPNVNDRQRYGAYIGGNAQMTMVDEQRLTNRNLADIKVLLATRQQPANAVKF